MRDAPLALEESRSERREAEVLPKKKHKKTKNILFYVDTTRLGWRSEREIELQVPS